MKFSIDKSVFQALYAISLNVLVVLSASVTENSTVEPPRQQSTARPSERSLSQFEYLSEINNEIYGSGYTGEPSSNRDDPSSSLDGVYSECLINLSFPCLQKKIILFLDRLSRKKQVSLVGDFLTVVKMKEATSLPSASPQVADRLEARMKSSDESSLKSVIDGQVDRFFETRVLRVRVPSFFDDPGTENTVVDIDFGTSSTSPSEGKFVFLYTFFTFYD